MFNIVEKNIENIIALLFLFFISGRADNNWKELALTSAQGHLWYSTSELEAPSDMNEIGKYSAVKIFDNNPATCWAEGVEGPGIGEKIYFDIPENLTALKIRNGLAKNESIFKKNNRLKKVKLTVYGSVTTDEDAGQFADLYRCLVYDQGITINLDDTFKMQEVKVPLDWKALKVFKNHVLRKFETLDYAMANKSKRYFKYILCMEIADVYKGSKWDDTCISDVDFVTGDADAIPNIIKIYTNDDENKILFDTDKKNGNRLLEDKEAVFQIVENSADKKWLIVIRMPAQAGDSRVETEYQLYYLPLRKRIDLKEAGYNVGDMYDFSIENGHTYLNCSDAATLDDVKIDLDKILSKTVKK